MARKKHYAKLNSGFKNGHGAQGGGIKDRRVNGWREKRRRQHEIADASRRANRN